jgi:hypothetical protein
MPPNRWHRAKSVLVVFVHGYSRCVEAVGVGCFPRRVNVEVPDSTAQAIRMRRTDGAWVWPAKANSAGSPGRFGTGASSAEFEPSPLALRFVYLLTVIPIVVVFVNEPDTPVAFNV